jgi:hypothetical protein
VSKSQIPYPEMFAGLGRYIAKLGITNVCVMEFENGIIVTGSVLYETGESFNRRIETKVLSHDDLRRLAKER